MTSFTSPGHIPIWDFFFNISECHILPARGWTPALMLHLTNPYGKRKVLSQTKPAGKTYKTKSLGHYITSWMFFFNIPYFALALKQYFLFIYCILFSKKVTLTQYKRISYQKLWYWPICFLCWETDQRPPHTHTQMRVGTHWTKIKQKSFDLFVVLLFPWYDIIIVGYLALVR